MFTGGRNAVYEYCFVSRVRLNTVTVTSPPAPRDAIALGPGLFLDATGNQIWSAPATSGVPFIGASPPFTNILGGTGTGNTQFVDLTEMAFGPGSSALLYTLDWGTQTVKVFDLSDPNQNYFRYSFALPVGLNLTNTTGLGFAVNDVGHVFVADGLGGGDEFSSTGALLASFDPPGNDTLGINTNLGDSSYITFDAAGDVFVENGTNGLHWYRDTSGAFAVPEPSTFAAILGVMALSLGGARELKRRRQVAVGSSAGCGRSPVATRPHR